VGTSGWSYPDWKGVFYPKGTKAGDYLSIYSEHFSTVEVDGSYYRAPSVSDCERWHDLTPDDFTFTLKMPKAVVHGGEPRDAGLVGERVWNWEQVGRVAEDFIRVSEALGAKRGPILLQCPRYPEGLYESWPAFVDAVAAFVKRLPDGPDYVLETRNKKWLEPGFREALGGLDISVVMADFRRPDGTEKKTFPQMAQFSESPTDFVRGRAGLVRLIGDRYEIENITTHWKEAVVPRGDAIKQWAATIAAVAKARGVPIYAYANNHYAGHGPETARELIAALKGM
jgi:uncharacterized protein YecE (DUF72 family)